MNQHELIDGIDLPSYSPASESPVMTHIADAKLVEMLEGLEGVTPGPWEVGRQGDYGNPDPKAWASFTPIHGKGWGAFASIVTKMDMEYDSKQGRKNAAHIARCDPDTIRSLILELQSLRSVSGELLEPTVFTQPVPGHWSTDEGTEMANRHLVMKREDLGYGHLTDLELANAVYMADRGSLDLIVYQTAAKDRIRWLSAQLAAALYAHPVQGVGVKDE